LVELVVVLFILGLTYAVVPPMFSNSNAEGQLRQATHDLAALLKDARTQAIAQREERVVLVDLEGRRYGMEDQGPSALGPSQGHAPGPPKKNSVHPLPIHVEIKFFGAASEQRGKGLGGIRFFPDGSSTGGRVTLLRKRQGGAIHGYYVDVNWATGRIHIDTADEKP
jgi:general secretion pathway protein H